MIFRSKIDGFFVTFMSIVILLIGAITLLPPLIDKEASIAIVMIMTAMFIILAGLLLWMSFSIKYIFYENYLLVKGGPFKSKIAYQSIRKISPTKDIFTGYRILSARNGLELFYDSAILGSVKISPKNRKEFITELKKRCPNVHIQE
ncbi:PH domain-containing protein [Oceanobacillus jeddahense]|uniref:PH domain-containing protein n=1 Tax=Oceanobacillus jeddahense TaxID=1462527 RepID=A0ABY5JLC9_9BACI|nr:PH domain-containing protein [Oceanobacillus jeddahense]UUI01109.1 PH domain-containing protein [Oceanobacillus jeddahense]